jgi:hypothetical protein
MKAILASITAIAMAATLVAGDVAPAVAQQGTLASKEPTPANDYRPYDRGDYGYYRGDYGDYSDDYGYYNRHRGYRERVPGYRYYNGFWFPPAAFLGLFLGSVIGGAALSAGGGHVRWCYNTYRSYRRSDNTYQPYYGQRRQCVSPYY